MTEAELVASAKRGSTDAFGTLVEPLLPAMRSFALRLVMHPQDADDLVQDTLLQAQRKLRGFRGDATFRTWVFSILSRKCIDLLRARKRWPVSGQTLGADLHVQSPALMARIEQAAAAPTFRYDYREHIAYCFSCVGRALEPEEAAAVLLREVFEMTNAEAAEVLGLSVPTFRHRLAHARQFMKETFEGTCALVGKQGVCWQCDGLRQVLPEDRRGAPVQPIGGPDDDRDGVYRRRLAIVREAKFGTGNELTKSLHDYLVGYMAGTLS